MTQQADGLIGTRDDESDTSEFNANAFLIQQMINRVSTATLVQVVAVTNAGGAAAVGFVDVHPLVRLLDGAGNAVPDGHGTIYHLPYIRIQGGVNAIILDPEVGDIGIALFADHDLSSVKATRAEANPGSRRRFDMADGLYIGGVLNGVPQQYVRFATDGITVVSPTLIKCVAPIVEIDGDLHATGVVIAGFGGADQVGLQTHHHTVPSDTHGDAVGPTNVPTAGT